MKKTFFQMLRFGFVGVSNTLITLGLIFLLMNILGLDYRIANGIGYLAGLINSFIWNRNWTFRAEGNWFEHFLKFVLAFGFCYILQFFLLIILIEKLLLDKEVSTLLAMVLYTFVNYILNKFWTFRMKG